jgi:hypothetical protein
MSFAENAGILFTYSYTPELYSNTHTLYENKYTWFKNNYHSLNFEKLSL